MKESLQPCLPLYLYIIGKSFDRWAMFIYLESTFPESQTPIDLVNSLSFLAFRSCYYGPWICTFNLTNTAGFWKYTCTTLLVSGLNSDVLCKGSIINVLSDSCAIINFVTFFVLLTISVNIRQFLQRIYLTLLGINVLAGIITRKLVHIFCFNLIDYFGNFRFLLLLSIINVTLTSAREFSEFVSDFWIFRLMNERVWE